MTTENNDRIKTLELRLDEQRRDHDCIERLYESAKIRVITYLAAGLALLGYLYASVPTSATTLKDKLFFPNEPYGAIIYALALAIYMFGLVTLLVALRPMNWSTAYDNEQEDILMQDYETYLNYMSKRYLRASRINGKSYSNKQHMLNLAFPSIVLGAILLLLLKTFGG